MQIATRSERDRARHRETVNRLRHAHRAANPLPDVKGHRADEPHRFERMVQREERCWRWTGQKGPHGHGMFRRKGGERIGAHRMSWIIHRGQIPVGMSVLHLCDNGWCVRPEHLYLGTQRDNMLDRSVRGRAGKLSQKDVRDVASRAARGETASALAEEYGVLEDAIRNVVKGRGWKSLGLVLP